MDHLTWLMLLQETDGSVHLPSFPTEPGRLRRQEKQDGGITVASAAAEEQTGTAAASAAYEALAEALERTLRAEAALERGERTALIPEERSFSQRGTSAQWETAVQGDAMAFGDAAAAKPGIRSEPAVPFAYRERYGEIVHEAGDRLDMEEISRFFERDARRF